MLSQSEKDRLRDDLFPAHANATVIISRKDEQGEVDPASLEYLTTKTVVYEGPGIVYASTRTYERGFTMGEAHQMARTYVVRILPDAHDLRVGDLVEFADNDDDLLTDTAMRVVDPFMSTDLVSRKIMCQAGLGF